MSFVNGLFSPTPTANQTAAEKAERNKENAEMQAAKENSNRTRNIAIGKSMFNAAMRANKIGNSYGSSGVRNRLIATGYISNLKSEPRITNKKNGPKTLAEELEFNKGMGKPLNFYMNMNASGASVNSFNAPLQPTDEEMEYGVMDGGRRNRKSRKSKSKKSKKSKKSNSKKTRRN
jgi:hypothetical protein